MYAIHSSIHNSGAETRHQNYSLRIAIWNANGLTQRLEELELFLNTEKIDICLISETHFTSSSYVSIRRYTCYHTIHPAERARGGSAIFIRDNINHHEELKIEKESMQVTTVTVKFGHHNTCNISAIYCPPRYNLKKEDYINLFQKLGSNFIIGGDFNAKNTFWGSRLTSPKGKEFIAAGQYSNCKFY